MAKFYALRAKRILYTYVYNSKRECQIITRAKTNFCKFFIGEIQNIIIMQIIIQLLSNGRVIFFYKAKK